MKKAEFLKKLKFVVNKWVLSPLDRWIVSSTEEATIALTFEEANDFLKNAKNYWQDQLELIKKTDSETVSLPDIKDRIDREGSKKIRTNSLSAIVFVLANEFAQKKLILDIENLTLIKFLQSILMKKIR